MIHRVDTSVGNRQTAVVNLCAHRVIALISCCARFVVQSVGDGIVNGLRVIIRAR